MANAPAGRDGRGGRLAWWREAALAAAVVMLPLAGGCAFVDERLELGYPPCRTGNGDHGQLYMAKPIDRLNLQKNAEGLYIVDHVKNGYGMDCADVLLCGSVVDWTADAANKELGAAGFTVSPVESVTDSTRRSVEVSIIEIRQEVRMGAWSAGMPTSVTLEAKVIDARGERRFERCTGRADRQWSATLELAKMRGELLTAAMQDCMRQLVPRISDMLR